jgi:hypothetical protein
MVKGIDSHHYQFLSTTVDYLWEFFQTKPKWFGSGCNQPSGRIKSAIIDHHSILGKKHDLHQTMDF